jgi:hypothetical protein
MPSVDYISVRALLIGLDRLRLTLLHQSCGSVYVLSIGFLSDHSASVILGAILTSPGKFGCAIWLVYVEGWKGKVIHAELGRRHALKVCRVNCGTASQQQSQKN